MPWTIGYVQKLKKEKESIRKFTVGHVMFLLSQNLIKTHSIIFLMGGNFQVVNVPNRVSETIHLSDH